MGPMTSHLAPPAIENAVDLVPALLAQGYAVAMADQVCHLAGVPLPALNAWSSLWNDLPPDHYLRDGGRYRRRRHSCFVVAGNQVTQAPHRPHWQPLEYNALHGGMQRHFEPMPGHAGG